MSRTLKIAFCAEGPTVLISERSIMLVFNYAVRLLLLTATLSVSQIYIQQQTYMLLISMKSHMKTNRGEVRGPVENGPDNHSNINDLMNIVS